MFVSRQYRDKQDAEKFLAEQRELAAKIEEEEQKVIFPEICSVLLEEGAYEGVVEVLAYDSRDYKRSERKDAEAFSSAGLKLDSETLDVADTFRAFTRTDSASGVDRVESLDEETMKEYLGTSAGDDSGEDVEEEVQEEEINNV